MPGVAFANGQSCGIVIGASGECIQAESTEQEREYKCIARIPIEVPLGAGQGYARFSLDGCGHDLDVLAFALAYRGRQLSGVRGLGARLGEFHIHLMDASSRDVSDREGSILRDGAVE